MGNKIFEPVTSSIGDSFTFGSEPLELTLGAKYFIKIKPNKRLIIYGKIIN
jgi:hypothetical protein